MTADAEITIGGDTAALEAAMKKAGETVQQSMGQIQSHVEGAFSKLNGLMAGLAAALAGGAAFSAAIDETVNLTKEADLLGRALGISATEAGILGMALGDIYLSGDNVIAAAKVITKQLKDNEGAFKDLGVATRDQNGNYRNSVDLIFDVNAALLQYQEGTDRNVEGQKIYGKSWFEVSETLKLTTELMESSRQKAAALGLQIGKEDVEATARYRAALNDVGDVLSGIKKTIGDAVLPTVTALAEWFADKGPAAVEITRRGMDALGIVFDTVGTVATILYQTIDGAFRSIGRVINDVFGKGGEGITALELFTNTLRLAAVSALTFKAFLEIDFKGIESTIALAKSKIKRLDNAYDALFLPGVRVADQWKQDTAEIEKVINKSGDEINALINGFMGEFDRILTDNGLSPKTPSAAPKPGGHSTGGKDKPEKAEPSRMPQWEAELEEAKAKIAKEGLLDDQFREMTKQKEKAFWDELKAMEVPNETEKLAIRKKYAALEIAEAKQILDAKIAVLKAESDQYKHDYDEKIRLAEEAASHHQAGIPGYEAEMQKVNALKREKAEQSKRIDEIIVQSARDSALAEIEVEKNALGQKLALGQISQAQALEQEKQFENRSYAILNTALNEKYIMELASGDQNTEAKKKIFAEMLTLTAQHQARIKALDGKAEIENLNIKIAALNAESEKYKYNYAEKIRIAQAIQALYANDVKVWQEQQQKINGYKRDEAAQAQRTNAIIAQSTRDRAMAEIDAEQNAAGVQLSLRQITQAQYIELEQQFENQRHENRKAALETERREIEAAGDGNIEALAKIQAKEQALNIQHQAKLNDIRAKSALESEKYNLEAVDSVRNGIATMVAEVNKGTKTMTDAFRAFATNVINSIADIQAKKVAASIMDSSGVGGTIKSIIGSLIGGSFTPPGTSAATTALYNGAAMPGSSPGFSPPFANNMPAAMPDLSPGFTLPSLPSVSGYVIPDSIISMAQPRAHAKAAPETLAGNMAGSGGSGGAAPNVTLIQHIHVDARSDMSSIMGAMAQAKNAAVNEITNQLQRGGAMRGLVRGA